jgi:transcription elongation factor Elf1
MNAAGNNVLPDVETTHELLGFGTCPSCRTTDATMTYDALGKGTAWQCARCGQKWSATCLATVAAYAAWVSGQTGLGRST